MSNKVIKCHSCGYPLEASSVSQNRIKCPKCGVVNVIETAKSHADFDSEGIAGGFPLSAGGAAIHKSIVAWIIANKETAPTDVFEHLRITGVERLYLPCYLFDCYSSIHYSYQIGNMRERVRKINESDDCLETYTEYTHQNDDFDFSDVVLVSGCSQYSDKIQTLYNGAVNVSNLTDVDSLKRPADVKELSFDVPFSNAQAEAKTIVGKRSHDLIVNLLKRSDYKDLHVRDDYRVEYPSAPKRILAPLIHVTFAYKEKTGDFWLSGGAERVIGENFPQSLAFRKSCSELNSKMVNGGCLGCLPVCFGLYLAIGGIIEFFSKSAPTGAPFLLLLLGALIIGLGGYLLAIPDIKNQKINSKLERLKNEHDEIFTQFLKKQVPLNGVLQKGLLGKPEAFPDKLVRIQLNVTSIGPQKAEVVNIVQKSTNISLKHAVRLVSRTPLIITCDSDTEADSIQKELESVGATVTRSYTLP